MMRDIRIGLFKSDQRLNQWSYSDSYMGHFSVLSPQQTISKSVNEFAATSGRKLSLQEDQDLYVDCWVQDSHGIYLFNFFLEREP
jgi:hypothetical protein